MPELPEVETMRRGILPIVGSRVADVERPPCPRKPIQILPRINVLRRRVKGQAVAAVERVGKRVVIRLKSEDRLILEPRMTGLVLVSDPPTREHLRFRLSLKNGPIRDVWFWDRRGLGSVRLLSPPEFERALGRDKLGPDALVIAVEELRERLTKSSRPIKVALLDQTVVAGIGNLYASELLFLAKISPRRSCRQLKRPEWARLHEAMLHVLEQAILHEGSTLSDGTYRNTLNQDGGYQNQHRVYDWAGELCSICRKEKIVRIVQAQRSTFYCPACQERSRSS